MEVGTELGDVIAFSISSAIKSRVFEEVLEEIKSQGALAIASHPFDPLRRHIGENAKLTDAVEINSHAFFGNGTATSFAHEMGLALVGGSDAHTPFEIGSSYTVCDEPVSAIKHKKTVAVGGFNWSYVPIAVALHLATMPQRLRKWTQKRSWMK